VALARVTCYFGASLTYRTDWLAMIERFAQLIPEHLLDCSGKVFYSGRSAFTGTKPVYVLGLNPGGAPEEMPHETLRSHSRYVMDAAPADWSEYLDEAWALKAKGECGMQPRVCHLLRRMGLDPRGVPASNLIFTRSARERGITRSLAELASYCWPFHAAVIAEQKIRIVVCFGRSTSRWVCAKLGAHQRVDTFVEKNHRQWRSESFKNECGTWVLSLTHPSIAEWRSSVADPFPVVERALAQR
jgi:hypothetical protein